MTPPFTSHSFDALHAFDRLRPNGFQNRPVTNQVKRYPFEVSIPKGLKASGAILTDQVKSLDWKTRNVEFICEIPEEIIKTVLKKLNTLLS